MICIFILLVALTSQLVAGDQYINSNKRRSDELSPSPSSPPLSSCQVKALDGTCFGHDLKRKYFLQASNFTNFNHGSFGAVPRIVFEQQTRLYQEQENRIDTWFHSTYYSLVDAARARLAALVNCMADDLVLVENASAAVNSILRSFPFVKGDKVLRLSTAYGMIINTLEYLQETVGIEVVVVDVEYPVTGTAQIINSVQKAIDANPGIKMSIFTHISSYPSMIEPVHELVKIAKDAGSYTFVDGAQALGVLSINISEINCDFYLGNAQKWLYSPKGTAFLYVKRELQTDIFPEPAVINSWGASYVVRYRYTGTRDYTAFCAIPAAMDFIEQIGGAANVDLYIRDLAIKAGKILTAAWNSSLLVSEDMTGYIINVILPSTDVNAIGSMAGALSSKHGFYFTYGSVNLTATTGETVYYTRLSAQVYLELSDFEKLAYLVLTLLAEYTPP